MGDKSKRFSWDKEDRARAKAEKKPLIAVAWDRSHTPSGGAACTIHGVGDDAYNQDLAMVVQKHEGFASGAEDPSEELWRNLNKAIHDAVREWGANDIQLQQIVKVELAKFSILNKLKPA